MSEQDNIVRDFLVESHESLDSLDQELVRLERDPQNVEVLNSIFRTFHTIKGTCGFLEFSKLERIAHVGENLLDSLRAKRIVFTPQIATALLQLLDAIRYIFASIEGSGSEGDKDYAELVAQLVALNGQPKEPEPETDILSSESAVQPEADDPAGPDEDSEPALEPSEPEQVSTMSTQTNHTVTTLHSDPRTTIELTEVLPEKGNEKRAMEETTHNPEQMTAEGRRGSESSPDEKQSGLSDSSLRVDVALLDQLMNLVGELVLARNQILQFTKTQSDAAFIGTSQRLNLITSELQEGVMKTRMQPIANVWNKFPRVVRDVARACGKEVRIDMQGKETDLDKTIIEAIKDPLTHIVRNSVDHGIESPDVRLAAGKPREGRLLLRAFHEGGHVIIEISDDGAGLNTERIRAKALEKGLITRERAAQMNDQEIARLIFAPGFSTAEKITNISGRGVGMDVVRSNIERIGGDVDVFSRLGEGTTLKIKIPLTLAIVPALIVSTGGQRFAVPQVSLIELVRVAGENIQTQIEEIRGALFYRLRGNLLPLVYLHQELRMSPATAVEEDQGIDTQVVNIVVVRADEHIFGLVVDNVHDTEEIVVKPLGKQLKEIEVFAGATIMGDGRVALIVDVPGLAKQSRIRQERVREKGQERLAGSDSADAESTRQALLIVGLGEDYRTAIPLSLVNRLEEFPNKDIERASGREVIQYRGGILPLVDLRRHFGGTHEGQDEMKRVVVYAENGRSVGLVVEQIMDIVEENVVLQHREGRPGILGTSIIQKKVTDLLDVPAILRQADSSFYNQTPVNGGI